MVNPSEKELSDTIIREFTCALKQRLGARVLVIILYGSRARGDFWEGSDFDFLVVVDRKDRDLEDAVLDLEYEFLDRYERLVTAQILTSEMWDFERRMPWGMNIQREGLVL